jgi:signal transduction histidine kinase
VSALVQRTGVDVDLRLSGDLPFDGDDVDALRVVQNLMFNAARESRQHRDACVSVALHRGELRISNPCGADVVLDDSIYDAGTSHRGSTGLGLWSARDAARRLGWKVRHEVAEGRVTFVVVPHASDDAGRTLSRRWR